MSVERLQYTIAGDAPGHSVALNGFRIGPENATRKVFLQGALHADEQPGILVLSHLLPMLEAADARGELSTSFVLFPMVNPVGMGGIGFGQHQGRYDLASGVNFNRDWPDLFAAIETDIDGRLGEDADANVAEIRAAIHRWLDGRPPGNLRDNLRLTVMREAVDADYVFDLHCDNEALVHIFSAPHCNAVMESLSDWLGGSAILTANDSGGGSFDEVWPLPYLRAAEKYPELPIPVPVAACTIELRGRFDVFDDVAKTDARNLFGFFQGQGLVGGERPPEPARGVRPTPLNATEILRVDRPGLLAYQVQTGDQVRKGDVVAELLQLDGPEAFTRRLPVTAGTDGLVLSRNARKYVWPGCSVAKIVGTEPLASRTGKLLED